MSSATPGFLLGLVCLAFLAGHWAVWGADAVTPGRPAIYDPAADGVQQVADAVARARKENKRVLLQFGANWCGWCHKLHRLFTTDPAISAKLKADYVVVMVDADQKQNAAVIKRYGNPTEHGLPVIVILDSDGKQLTTQDTGKLEQGDHHDPSKVMAFLVEWAPPRQR